MGGRQLVLHDMIEQVVPKVLHQGLPQILDQATEGIAFPIGTGHGQPSGLQSPNAKQGTQAAGNLLQIQDLDFDRGAPQVPVAATQEPFEGR